MKLRKIGKSLLAMFLSLCLMSSMLTLFTISAAATTATSGTTGDCTWTLDGTTLTISGDGTMDNYSYSSSAPWGTEISRVVIEDGVTIVGNYAFSNCIKLESITLPNGITSIGEDAFYNCRSLASITLPKSITSIGIYAFDGCVNLASIDIPKGVKTIDEGTFYECFSLESITIPSSVKTIGYLAFYECISLETVYYCGTDAAYNEISIDNYDLGNSYLINATRAHQHEFEWVIDEPSNCSTAGVKHEKCIGCDSVKNEGTVIQATGNHAYDGGCDTQCNTCGTTRTALSAHAYASDCDIECDTCKATRTTQAIHTYDSDFDVKCNYCGYARTPVANAESLLTYTVNNGKVTITDCDTVISGDVVIPSTIDGYPVTAIADKAFYGCVSLKSVVIPDSVTSMGAYAFYGCSAIKDVTIGNGIKSIGKSAFYGCSSLESVSIGNGVKSIGKQAFYECSKLASINIPNSVTSIGEQAFYKCSGLTSAVLGNSVKTIEANAFAHCEALESINIPKSITSIGEHAFLTSRKLSRVSIDDLAAWCNISFENETANPIHNGADQKKLYIGGVLATDITIPDGVQSIANYAFYNCDSLTNVVIPDSVTHIGEYAFYHCNYMTSITIPDSVTTIGDHAFDSCTFKGITIPKNLTSIGEGVFKGSKLVSVTIPGNIKTIGDVAFYWNNKLTSVVIEDGATDIGEMAFYNCEVLTNLSIPKSVINIGHWAFNSCYKLETVCYAGTKSEWDAIKKDTSAFPTKTVVYYNHPTHNYQTVVKEPTCTEKGYTAQTCADCGHEIIDESTYVAATGHRWRVGNTVAPTCTSDGYTMYSCRTCSKTQKDDVKKAPGHTLKLQGRTEANCSENGYDIYLCTTCGETVKKAYANAYGHIYSRTVVEPTCEEEGYTLNSCYYCDYSYKNVITPPKGHFWLESKTVEPTCSEKGYTEYTCKNCNQTQKDDFVETISHTFTSTVTPPTETVHGYTTHTCSVCGYVYKDSHVPATGEGAVNGVQNMQISASDTNITVTWDAIAGATKYNLYVNDAEGNNLITRALSADRTSVTLSWPNELEWDKTYSIGIRAKTTKWLDTVYKTAALTVANRVVDVKTQSVGRNIEVTWKAYEGATSYRVYVYKKGEYPSAFTNVKSSTNSAIITNAIYAEVDYEVRVVATVNGVQMKTVDAMPIAARLNIFCPSTARDRGITPTKVEISWEQVRGADRYWVYLTPVNGGDTVIKEATGGTPVAGLTPGTTYTIQVQARITDSDGKVHYSGKSAVLGTVTTTEWEDINFTAVASDSGADLSWKVPTNAYRYIIYRSTNGGSVFKKIETITDASVTSYTDTAAKSGYVYAIVTELQNGYVSAKSPLVKSQPIIK